MTVSNLDPVAADTPVRLYARPATVAAYAFVLMFFSAGLFASDAGHEEVESPHEEHGKHNLGMFVGVTREDEHNLATLGVEYSYRINKSWSVGGVIERADRDKDSTLGIVFVHLWPTEFLYLGVGVGRKDPGGKRENTARATIGYEFELGRGWSISPQANADFIEHEENEEVFGIVIAKRF